ncbi:uncharacterized protein TNCV_4880941 [Trichonephila clavipes]|nr:uncharacterized protein TNCV_4880941 [Trichonephila clavipes]
MIRWALKLSEFNIEWEHRPGVQSVVADVLSRNPVGNLDGSQISCAALRALALNSREQLIREQREDPELGHIYRYLENPDDGPVNATVCEGKFKGSRKTSSEESNGHKSNKGNAGWEDPRLKRKVGSNGSRDRKDLKKSKICRKRSLQRFEHRDQKRPTPEPKQGIKRAVPSSVPSRNYKYRRPNNPSQGSQSIAGPSHLRNSRQDKPPTEGSKHDMTGQYDKARETRTTTSGTNRAAERRPVRSKQATAVRPCPYYLRSRVKKPEGVPEDRGIGSNLKVSHRTTSGEGASRPDYRERKKQRSNGEEKKEDKRESPNPMKKDLTSSARQIEKIFFSGKSVQ